MIHADVWVSDEDQKQYEVEANDLCRQKMNSGNAVDKVSKRTAGDFHHKRDVALQKLGDSCYQKEQWSRIKAMVNNNTSANTIEANKLK